MFEDSFTCCRYSLIDADMKSVERRDVVMTEVWRVAADKSLSCILGDMQSCESEEIIIDTVNHADHDTPVENNLSSSRMKKHFGVRTIPSISKKDYHEYLINNVEHPGSSDYDTDDLIEDARNFVKESKSRYVDNEVWKEIDQTRRQKRKSKKERDKNLGISQYCDNKVPSFFVPNMHNLN